MQVDWIGFVGPKYDSWDTPDDVAEANGITEVATRNLFKALDANDSELTINLSTDGGYTNAGIAIMNLLRIESEERRKTLPSFCSHIRVIGVAYSAGAIICLGADKVTMMPGTEMMIHRALTSTWGNYDAHIESAEYLKKTDERLIEIFSAKMSKNADDTLKLLADETYLSPTEAQKLGLVASIDTTNEAAVKVLPPPQRTKSFNYARWFEFRRAMSYTGNTLSKAGNETPKSGSEGVASVPTLSVELLRLSLEMSHG